MKLSEIGISVQGWMNRRPGEWGRFVPGIRRGLCDRIQNRLPRRESTGVGCNDNRAGKDARPTPAGKDARPTISATFTCFGGIIINPAHLQLNGTWYRRNIQSASKTSLRGGRQFRNERNMGYFTGLSTARRGDKHIPLHLLPGNPPVQRAFRPYQIQLPHERQHAHTDTAVR